MSRRATFKSILLPELSAAGGRRRQSKTDRKYKLLARQWFKLDGAACDGLTSARLVVDEVRNQTERP